LLSHYVNNIDKESEMKVRLLCIFALFILPMLFTAGCGNNTTDEEQRPIIIPSEEDGFMPGQPPADQGFPPFGKDEFPEQNTAPPQTPEPQSGSNITTGTGETVALPAPHLTSDVSLEEALLNRRSVMQYSDSPLTLDDVSQLLWAARRSTDDTGKRTAPTTMAGYPLQLFLIAGDVTGLASGNYLYNPEDHELKQIEQGDMREALGMVSSVTGKSPVYIIVTADITNTPDKAGEGTDKFAYLEAGQASQNICLQATALGLGTATIVDFKADQIKNATGITEDLGIIYVMPVGHIEEATS
jgi:SagB-type dehydrogenase family enzyme